MKGLLTPQIRLSCFIIVVSFLLFLTGEANPFLAFNRQDFYVWQLVSAHLIHYDFKHLILNMLALLILLYLFPTKNKELISGFIIAVVLIDAYMLLSDVQFYVGFSGLLYVIPGLALGRYILAKKYAYALLISCIFVIYMISCGQMINISNDITWVTLTQAHILGFVSGIVVLFIIELM